MAIIARCPTCGEAAETGTCTSCEAESPAGTLEHTRDQAADDRDKTAEDRDQAAELRDRGAEGRDAVARRQEQTNSDRDRLASALGQSWSDHDRAASERDQRSADADQRAAAADFAAGGDAATFRHGARARELSGRDRVSVAVLRDEATASRLHEDPADTHQENTLLLAEHDREDAAGDREGAAGDREQAASDRADALRSRTESADAALRALATLESMSDAFFTLDHAWRFTYVNPQTEVILERRRDDLIGRSVWEEFPATAGSVFDEELRQATERQVPARFEEHFERLDRTLEVRGYPVSDGLAVYFTDVTTERLREARLRQTERLEMLGQLTAGVAHDFNNVISAVGGFAQLGRTNSADETTVNYFDQIHAASERGTALIGQLLAFGRQQDLSPAAIDLNEVVDGLSALLRQLMRAGVELRLALAPHPVTVFVDRSQLEQVVLNLVVNSRDAIEARGSITISTTSAAPEGLVHEVDTPSGWLQVADTGSGIPEEVRTHIFDPFFSTKPVETGTGLGLATIYGIVSQSGGTIFVDSTVDVGTTMTVALPADQPPR
jgi:PAS domain S-box-containing protein